MRLICPRCGAQYEIDAAAIPETGRDVECSACDQVWRAFPTLPFDATARPTLSRPLSESVIGVLREEAERELEARAAEARDLQEGESKGGAVQPERTDPQRGSSPSAQDPASAAGDQNTARRDFPEPAAPPRESRPLPSAPRRHTAPPGAKASAAARAARRARYDAGFRLAVIVALVAVALYALAPRLAGQDPYGPILMEWRAKVDHGRDRLAEHGDDLVSGIRGTWADLRADP